jgi:outer membrane protein OmpA-like peptidoglycan-associated protein
MNPTRTRYAALPLALVLFLGMSLTACSGLNNTGKGAIGGAGAGAVIGGVIGKATGSTARGAIIGAAVGGTAGAVIGRQMDKQAEELEGDLENADVTPIEGEDGETAGIAVRFDNALLFDLGQATLRPGVRADLRDLASSLQNYPGHDAVIVGHASTDGSTALNQSLSERRANAVRGFLVEQGLSPSRLEAYGMGESEPLAGVPGESPENRRVEIAIYPSDDYRQSVESEYN